MLCSSAAQRLSLSAVQHRAVPVSQRPRWHLACPWACSRVDWRFVCSCPWVGSCSRGGAWFWDGLVPSQGWHCVFCLYLASVPCVYVSALHLIQFISLLAWILFTFFFTCLLFCSADHLFPLFSLLVKPLCLTCPLSYRCFGFTHLRQQFFLPVSCLYMPVCLIVIQVSSSVIIHLHLLCTGVQPSTSDVAPYTYPLSPLTWKCYWIYASFGVSSHLSTI